MDIRKIRPTGQQLSDYSYNDIVNKIKDFKYIRSVILAVVFGLSLLITFFMYRFFIMKNNCAAQTRFAPLFMQYDSNVNAESKQALIEDIIQSVEKNNGVYSSTLYDPYLGLVAVNDLVQKNETQKAVQLMEKVVAQAKGTPLFNLFLTKQALMLLDSTIAEIQQKGLEQLISVAQDTGNAYRDYSLYFLGRYYFLHNRPTDAKIAWQELRDTQIAIDPASMSPWAQLAKQKIEQII